MTKESEDEKPKEINITAKETAEFEAGAAWARAAEEKKKRKAKEMMTEMRKSYRDEKDTSLVNEDEKKQKEAYAEHLARKAEQQKNRAKASASSSGP